MVGMLIRPPHGDHAARPVSSYSTNSTLGAPSGAGGSRNGVQSGTESRTSRLITPVNFFATTSPQARLLPVTKPMESLDRAARYHPNRGKGEDRRPVPKRDFRPDRPRCSTPYGAVVDSGLTPVATVEAATELQRPESTRGSGEHRVPVVRHAHHGPTQPGGEVGDRLGLLERLRRADVAE